MVVLSAHWEGGRDSIEGTNSWATTDIVNTAENAALIYDFYGFPTHYYKQKYPNRGNKQLAEQVISLLRSNGIKASGTDRGLDHGIWVPFKVAFDPEDNPLEIPIVQGQ
jgi:aromatic ring-opening dioxygenase catalytic subunit (LigB family)